MTDRKTPTAESSLPVKWRVAVSLLILVHIIAIACPAFMLQAFGSPAGTPVMECLRPYIEFAYLNHGYAFFAPDPGPSHLVRAEITFDDDRQAISETFPDLEQQWPRLLYHRHFMLSEQLNSDYQPPQLPQEISQEPELAERWQTARRMYELKWRSYKQHIATKHNAPYVTLTRVRHRMIDVPEVRDQNKSLKDPDTFFDLREDGFVPQEGFIGGAP